MRVEVTGMAALTPIGEGLPAYAEGLRAGRDGVGPIRRFDASRHRVRRAAQLAWEKPEGCPWSRASAMALEVARDALAGAGLEPAELAGLRLGVVLASNQGGMAVDGADYRGLAFPYRRGRAAARAARVRMMDAAPSSTLDALVMQVGGAELTLNLSTACSAGLHAMGLGAEAVAAGRLDAVLVVGAEVLSEFSLAGFGVLRALTAGPGPRPFAADRDGTLLGEGAAALVLEPADRARARGARAWAEVVGYGSSNDAFHMTRPEPDGPLRAMRDALGSTPPEEVAWIKAHGTGTPHNDAAEAAAIRGLFGDRADDLPVTSLKAMLAHSLGASGVVEAVGTVLAAAAGFVPPTRNLDRPDPALGLDVVAGAARPATAGTVLMNAFGFGGNNAAVALRPAC